MKVRFSCWFKGRYFQDCCSLPEVHHHVTGDQDLEVHRVEDSVVGERIFNETTETPKHDVEDVGRDVLVDELAGLILGDEDSDEDAGDG